MVKIGDLGAALKLDAPEDLTEIKEDDEGEPKKVGTPFFIGPEVWMGKKITKRTDVWALGVILYEVCTKTYPFFAETIEELEAKVIKEKYKTLPATVNKQFADIISKCLVKKEANRPSIEDIIMMDTFQHKAKFLKI